MVAMERYLEGRVAIIIGDFSGIGNAIAIAPAERGASVTLGITLEDIQLNAGALW
jgi:NAD(P)-dependent dehydrogenase (short-subunit alcohol dehydrogenase family)